MTDIVGFNIPLDVL